MIFKENIYQLEPVFFYFKYKYEWLTWTLTTWDVLSANNSQVKKIYCNLNERNFISTSSIVCYRLILWFTTSLCSSTTAKAPVDIFNLRRITKKKKRKLQIERSFVARICRPVHRVYCDPALQLENRHRNRFIVTRTRSTKGPGKG